MRIEVKMTELIPAKTKKGADYEKLELTYKNDRGETKSKTLFPFFDGEAVHKALSGAVKGDLYDIQTVKNAEGFLDWTEAAKASDEPPASKVVLMNNGGTVPTAKQDWDSADKARQNSIVRQSSLKAALDFHDLNKATSGGAALADIFETAGKMQQWVDGTLVDLTFGSLEEDIPV